MLPYTGKKGAYRFVEDVLERIPDQFFPIPFSVFTFPDNWIEKKEGDKEEISIQKKPEENSDETAGRVINMFSRVSIDTTGRAHKLQERIKRVFIRKMPFWKRLTDVVLSSAALLVLSPLLLLVTLYIRIMSPGPVFFRQERVGYKGRHFTMLKFRTMKVNNNDSVHKDYAKSFINSDMKLVKLDSSSDSRIIPGCSILRKACIDELPQLINVLLGDMSLVGPRPPIPYEVAEYKVWHSKRFDMVPGLTGLWQVSGKHKLTFNQMIRLDIRYKKKMSFFFDIFIMLKTIPTIFGIIFEKTLEKMNREKSVPGTAKAIKKRPIFASLVEMFTGEGYKE